MDRRQQKTRAAIFEAFAKLLSSKSYSKITVQEIIDEANIGRTTFYAHFETKDMLLHEMCTDLFEHIFSDTPVAEHTHDFSGHGGNTEAMITHILYHLRDNKKNILRLLRCESSELFLQFFKIHLHEFITGYFFPDISDTYPDVPPDFLINHISCSFVGMIQWWIQSHLKQSPEELAAYFMSVNVKKK